MSQEGQTTQNISLLKLSELYFDQKCLISVTEFIEDIVAILA
jgi:hypothetical protein